MGLGSRFRPPASAHVESRCTSPLGRRFGVHVELFADGRTVLLPAGIGARAPLLVWEGRIAAADCFGALATLEPTGLVLVRPGSNPTLAALFSAWNQPLSARRLGPFGGHVTAFVGGRPWRGAPAAIPLQRHSEIVLEVGPYVPPHPAYEFPPGT